MLTPGDTSDPGLARLSKRLAQKLKLLQQIVLVWPSTRIGYQLLLDAGHKRHHNCEVIFERGQPTLVIFVDDVLGLIHPSLERSLC